MNRSKRLAIYFASSNVNLELVEQLAFLIRELNLPLDYKLLDSNSQNSKEYDLKLIFIESSEELNFLTQSSVPLLIVCGESVPKVELPSYLMQIHTSDPLIIMIRLLTLLKECSTPMEASDIINFFILFELLNFKLFANGENTPWLKLKSASPAISIAKQPLIEMFIAGKQGYCQENSIASDDSTVISFDLRPFHFLDINRIRFDPDRNSCVLKNCKFSIEYENSEIVELNNFSVNAVLVKYDKYYFETDDPQLEFHFRKINPLFFHCSFELEELDPSAFRNDEQWFFEVKNFYRNNREFYLSIFNSEQNHINDVSAILPVDKAARSIFIHLGPSSTNIDGINEALLNNMAKLIQNKIMYPTHQRPLYDVYSHGGLFTVFSKPFIGGIYFDNNKVKNLLKNIRHSRFNTLLLSSSEFLANERLRFFVEPFAGANYLYYLRNCIESCFEKYIQTVLYLNEKRKFSEVFIELAIKDFMQLYTVFKHVAKKHLLLRNISDYNDVQDLIADFITIINGDSSQSLYFDIKIKSNSYSHEAIEFRRLINYFPLSGLVNFLNSSLSSYQTENLKFSYLTENQQQKLLQVNREYCTALFQVFNHRDESSLLEKIDYIPSRQFVEQHLSQAEIVAVLKFLNEENHQNTHELLNIIKRVPRGIVNCEEFYFAIDEFSKYIEPI